MFEPHVELSRTNVEPHVKIVVDTPVKPFDDYVNQVDLVSNKAVEPPRVKVDSVLQLLVETSENANVRLDVEPSEIHHFVYVNSQTEVLVSSGSPKIVVVEDQPAKMWSKVEISSSDSDTDVEKDVQDIVSASSC